MKRHLLILAACIGPATGFTQNIREYKNPQQPTRHPFVREILQKQNATTLAYKTTAASKRLIANAYRSYGQARDSNHYYYSQGRGSVLVDASSYYDNYFPTSTTVSTKTLFCDSSINWNTYQTGQLDITNRKSYTYDGSGRVATMDYRGYNWMQYEVTYNSNNDIATVLTSDTSGGSLMSPKFKSYMSYTAQKKRAMDSMASTVIMAPLAKAVYTYDVNNNLIAYDNYSMIGVWTQTGHTGYTYDNSNRLVTTLSQYMGTGGLVNSRKDSNAYLGTGTNPEITIYYNWNAGKSDWDTSYMYRTVYNSKNAIDTAYIHQWQLGQWDTLERNIYKYDSDGLLINNNGYTYSGNNTYASIPYDTGSYYYEEYFPASVGSVTFNNNSIIVYPNPTNSLLNIDAGTNRSGTIIILNSAGQLIFSQENTSLKQAIDIQPYHPGNYILIIQDDNKQYISQKQFTKI